MPVDATHAYVGACLVTLSEEFEVLDCLSGIVGVPDMQYVYCHEAYPRHLAHAREPVLSNDAFLALYGFPRVKPAYYWRAGPRF